MWLLPKVWFHGNQSTMTGGSSATKARPQPIIAWLAQSMSWVLMTPLGWPVEPEVNRILAMVSGAILACAVSTAGVGCAFASVREQRRWPIARWICGDRDFDAGRHRGGNGASEGGAVGGEDQVPAEEPR